ncbi:MAG: ABC transporter substrate-binding protein [Eubacteriales bacterium]|nr:ABC transporter substrate-binding protein [Eubacteriales bacterium]
MERRTAAFLKFLTLLLCFAFLLSSCGLKKTPQKEQKAKEQEYSKEGISPDKIAQASPLLRIAARRSESWHPLEQDEAANQAVMALVYRGLFLIDSNEKVALDLAESAAFSEDGLHLTIALRKDLSFADGRAISSRDCASSLNYFRAAQLLKLDENLSLEERTIEILELTDLTDEDVLRDYAEKQQEDSDFAAESEEEEDPATKEEADSALMDLDTEAVKADFRLPALPFRESDVLGLKALQAIHSVELLDEKVLRINFNRYAPEIVYRLDFPILPATDLLAGKSEFPATGSFTVARTYGDGSLLLKSRDQAYNIKEILVKSYATEDLMLRALTEDELDLIYLGPEAYRAFSRRRDLRSLPKPGGAYHLLLPGTVSGHLFADPEVAKSFFRLWIKHPEYSERVVGLETAAFPLRPTADLWAYIRNLKQNDANLSQFVLAEQTKLQLVAPDLPEIAENAKLLRDMFFELNIDLEIQLYPEEEYPGVVKGGDYDLAYLVLDLDYPFDPISFYSQLAYYRSDFTSALIDLREEVYRLADFQRNLLSVLAKVEYNHDEMQAAARDYYKLMTEVSFYGLGFAAEGLLLSPRISEYFTLLPHDPYYHLKEITVWQNTSAGSSLP